MRNENPIKTGKILKMKNVRNVLKPVINSLDEAKIKKMMSSRQRGTKYLTIIMH